MTWSLARPDWAARLRAGESLLPDLPQLSTEGDRAVAVLNKLRLADVPLMPAFLDAGGDWFRDITRAFFGALDPVTRIRAIRELFLLVPKKNSKTTNGALMMLTALLLNERPRANFILTGPVQDSADLAFQAVQGAVEADDVLKKKLWIREHLKTIVHRETKATLEIMTFDPANMTGQKVSGGVLIDELHVIAKMAKAASALRQLRGGMIPFPEAFLAFITTQSEDIPSGVFRDELVKARAIRDGEITDTPMLPVLYEFPEDMQRDPAQWRDSANWHLVTPNAGRSIQITRLEEDMRTAERTSEAELRAWASQHLNVEIGLALAAHGWAGAKHWLACAEPTLTLEELIERSEVITFGADGGGLDDFLGAAAVGREAGTGNWLVWTKAWVHRDVLEDRKQLAPRMLQFAEQGDLVIVDQADADVVELVDAVELCEKSGLLDRIGVDPVGIGAIVDEITDRKIDHERILGIPQGWKLMGAIKTTERKLKARTLKHGGQELMAWCVGNARPITRGNAVMITRESAGLAKIDPLLALFDAVALMAMNPQPRKKKFQFFVAG